MNKNKKYINPDVLDTIANISSDEVFTPPTIVNKMLDNLPKHLFSSPNTTFLDPCTKSGIFLREIVKRLIKGLENWEPDLEKRIKHILKKQVFGISITGICHLMSKRSLYCSKFANDEFSLGEGIFTNNEGNLVYSKRLTHEFNSEGKCVKCGMPLSVLQSRGSNENYAYYFIHKSIDDIKARFNNMKFDVIIGNPPYQLEDGGAQSSATPIYHKFVEAAKVLEPKYLTMIIPSRWFAGGKGLDSFRNDMLNDKRIRKITDYLNCKECFPSVEIKGGVCYFLWDKNYNGDCEITTHFNGKVTNMTRPLLEEGNETFIRFNEAISILRKVKDFKETSFSTIVSSRKPFGFATNFKDFTQNKTAQRTVKIYANKQQGYVKPEQIKKNMGTVNKIKLFAPKAVGSADVANDKLKTILAEENTCCTETYITIGPFESVEHAENCQSYINTRFFHILLSLKKITQDTTQKCYEFIPLQDFSESWSDEKLYQKYNLTEQEINFIENAVWPEKTEE